MLKKLLKFVIVKYGGNLMQSIGVDCDLIDPSTKTRKRTIANHPIFTEMSSWKTVNVNALGVKDPMKREMAKHYLSILFEKTELHVKNLLSYDNDTALDNLTGTKLYENMVSIVKETEHAAMLSSVPYIFLNKFNTKLYKHIELLTDTLNEMVIYWNPNNTKDNVINRLDIVYVWLKVVVNDLEDTVNSMNGELRMALEGSIFDPNK